MKSLFTFPTLLLATCSFGQVPYATSIEPTPHESEIAVNRGSAALWQSLQKLHTRASLIMVTAHPDDEDGGMLAYESRGQGARVALLTLNRGEGGANVMSSDFFDALGLVRTMELLKAGEYYGVNQYWTRVIDYGFSKTKAESISKWTHDRVLYDVVRIVRMERPLVITSVFVGSPSDGHGNHQTAGAMAQEVFKAAGDPNVFPDQIASGLRPWTPLKDYARVPFRMRQGGPTLSTNVSIPEGDYNPLLGGSYVQMAREGLGFQKSQNGGGSIPKPGPMMSPYHRFGSNVETTEKESSFFDGIDVSLAGIATLARGSGADFLKPGLEAINANVETASRTFSAEHPENCAGALAAGMKATLTLIDQVNKSDLSAEAKYDILHELEIKRVQFNNALAESLGLFVNATVAPDKEMNPIMAQFLGDAETFRMAIPGQKFGVKVHIVNESSGPVKLVKASVEAEGQKSGWDIKEDGGKEPGEAAKEKAVDLKFSVVVPEDAALTKPYFTRPDLEQTYYTIENEQFLNRPLPPYPLAGWAEFEFNGAHIKIGQDVQTMQRVTGQGSVYLPLTVGPAISVAISPRNGIVPLSLKSFPVTAVIHSNVKGPANGSVRLNLPSGWTAEPSISQFQTSADGEDRSATFQVTPANLSQKPYQVSGVADYNGHNYTQGYTTTGYPGLVPYFLYRPATYSVKAVDVTVAPGLKVGYVMGSGDDVPTSLEHLGIHVSFLGPADIATGDLSAYDVILLGVRAYAARQDLATYNSRLLDYVKNGGVAIVQYNTPEFDHNFGPYPYSMTSNPEEVTDEASKVQILDPSNPIFNWPNKISEADFSGWVEERGSKWMKSWDPRYHALLEAHDQDQEPQKGGLLYAQYGKGIYVYNAWSFYRQLPEGVAGAYRLFANMLSLPKNPSRR
ncbi:MAG: PIG-L family deacetylase [Acidobacteriaceae bacterium]|nr:PIG-L family deacetylase [Acidobacteriaceae bacterium]